MVARSQWPGVSRRKIAVSLTLVCVLIFISGFIYSPWHRHNPASRQACLFWPVEACSTLEAGPSIQLQPPLTVGWFTAVWTAALPLIRPSRPRFGRAPPA